MWPQTLRLSVFEPTTVCTTPLPEQSGSNLENTTFADIARGISALCANVREFHASKQRKTRPISSIPTNISPNEATKPGKNPIHTVLRDTRYIQSRNSGSQQYLTKVAEEMIIDQENPWVFVRRPK